MDKELTSEDLDKVRDIEGFPSGADEDIIALSDPPHFTACPNPFIENFIAEHGSNYDESNDNYSCEPFAADVSEGKNDPIYNAHSYHTKVPYKAIMKYILHYTKPGDIVFDGFCGTGMTGVAAQMCGADNPALELEMTGKIDGDNWGKRFAILSDLSPAATFIASVYNSPVDVENFAAEFEKIFSDVQNEFDWMYETKVDGKIFPINYTVWSDVLICPNCGEEIIFWNVAVEDGNVKKTFRCPKCDAKLTKTKCLHAVENYFDSVLGEEHAINKQVPVLISYRVGKKKLRTKTPDDYDFEVLDKIERRAQNISLNSYPMMNRGGKNWGELYRAGYHNGFTHSHHFYTLRNYFICSQLWSRFKNNDFKWTLTSIMNYINKKQSFTGGGGGMPAVLYIASLIQEKNIFDVLNRKFESLLKILPLKKIFDANIVSCQSLIDLRNVPKNSVDYIFTDPPFGANIMYSEASFLWESWLKVFTNAKSEAIESSYQHKTLSDYQELMTRSFRECWRILKPNRWLTVEFHNSKNAVWNAIQESLMLAGFVIADVRTLDKKQGSFKQVTTTSAVKQDLIISAYKPKENLLQEFYNRAGEPETAWLFIREHLKNLPVVIKRGRNLESVSERQKFLLFDRMVAFHLMQGLPIPISAAEFYRGLEEKFLYRDEMYFLPSQANEYDSERVACDLEQTEVSMFIVDEKTAVDWINRQLKAERQTYQKLQPKFMQEPRVVKKGEKIPELATLLEENFLQDELGCWYIPDLKKIGDVEKLREKNLLREFQSYVESTGELKIFRSEALRAGFAKLYREGNYSTIVAIAERLPEDFLLGDAALLSYVDFSRQQNGDY